MRSKSKWKNYLEDGSEMFLQTDRPHPSGVVFER